MVELADIFRQYGPQYRAEYGERLLPSHRRAMAAIEACRTAACGGHVYACPECDETRYSYHSCQNRHCPKCQHEATQAWLAQQHELLLPAPYFLLTFTLPAELRILARRHQKAIYPLLFQASAAATQELAQDPRFVGGQIGMLGVLQTWTRELHYHPHVHYLVPGGGLTTDGRWVRARNHFFVHVKPLARLFRAKFRDGLRRLGWLDQAPAQVWTQDWVVHCQPAGSGEAALKYLAPYIFRIALSNRRILRLADDQVTFAYQEAASGRRRTCTLPVAEFLRRFLQHVLPKGFVKVRYYGFFSAGHRPRLRQVRHLLNAVSRPARDETAPAAPGATLVLRCPTCGRPMQLVPTLRPKSRCPPG